MADTQPLMMSQHIAKTMERVSMDSGWIRGSLRLPGSADGDQTGKLLVWHAYQGAMLATWWDYPTNRFHIYWMPLSALDPGWIEAADKLPTVNDADALNCVLVEDRQGDLKVTGYHQFSWNKMLVRWHRLPSPPQDAKELRQRI